MPKLLKLSDKERHLAVQTCSARLVSFLEAQPVGQSWHKIIRGIDFDVVGKLNLEIFPNVVLWSNVSDIFVAAVKQLLTDGHIYLENTSPLYYLLSGAALALPLVEIQDRVKFKKPSWLPTAVFLVPAPSQFATRATRGKRTTNPVK